MKILHIIREPDDPLAFEIAYRDGSQGKNEVLVILIHDGVYSNKNRNGLKILVLKNDREARSIQTDHEQIEYNRMLEIIFESERVITW